ncbi:MAG: hypothetical protein Q7S58_04155 [Candidatus Binatus sp.]|uniref:hypothetical protein n=1 Tax=Candidatus Binatus sp. TaxID=2811406 RepID=UPI0027257CA3|nr:hypothetical protein [Candidatus Binatus sp.]MDO8431584.1 hypothetical protein [Candidatus Binatus sp.]
MNATDGITHLALGNSLMAAGFSAAAFDRYTKPLRAIAFNAALGASDPVEHLMLLRRALKRDPTVMTVIYGFFDFQLTGPLVAANSDFIGNRAASYYLEPELVLEYSDMSPRDRFDFNLMRHVPLLVERGTIWEKVELVRRAMSQLGMPPVATNRMGQVSDFAMLEADSPAAFAARSERAIAEHAKLSAPIAQIIEQSKQHGARVVIVEMPMHPYHQRTFYSLPAWSKYRDYVRSLVEQAGGNYLNASDWIERADDFADHLHLSAAGADDFSRRLADYVRASNAAPSAISVAPPESRAN